MMITYNYDDFEMKIAFNLCYIFAKKKSAFILYTYFYNIYQEFKSF